VQAKCSCAWTLVAFCVLVYSKLPSVCGDLLPHLHIIVTLYHAIPIMLSMSTRMPRDRWLLSFPPTSALAMAFFPAHVSKDTGGTLDGTRTISPVVRTKRVATPGRHMRHTRKPCVR
jgi:hypothetical protein